MATEDKFIVAIELGSSKVTGIAGRKQPDGALQVLAFAQEPASTFMRKGRINNIDKMKSCIKNIKERLEKSLKKSISCTYIGIGGMGMHTVANSVVRNFTEKTVISEDIVGTIQDENLQSQPADRDILETVIQSYKLDAQTLLEPVGVPAESIEGHFLNIITKREVSDHIEECVEAAGMSIAGVPITVLALANEMVNDVEKHSGCVFVDMGAETTSVAVFKNNILRHLAVIPLGGNNITRDIASMSISEPEAERLKRTYGEAIYDDLEEPRNNIVTEGGLSFPFEDFAGHVEARQEEIIRNVAKQVELSKYTKNQLLGGIIITGGASNMKGIEKAFAKYTDFTKIQVVKTIRTQVRFASGVPTFNHDGSCNAAIVLLDKGTINCCGGELESPQDIFKAKQEAEARAAAERAAAERAAEESAAEEERKKREEAEQKAQEKAERAKRRGEKMKKFFSRFSNWANDMVGDKDNPED